MADHDEPGGGTAPAADEQAVEPNSIEDALEEEVFEGIPLAEGKKREVIRRMELMFGKFSSPVPPPIIMKEHGEVLSSAPERILSMAERQAAHRQRLENRTLLNGDIRSYVGQGFAFVIAMVFGYWSYDLIKGGEALAGVFLGTVDLVGLVSVFILGRKRQVRDAQRSPEPPSSPKVQSDDGD